MYIIIIFLYILFVHICYFIYVLYIHKIYVYICVCVCAFGGGRMGWTAAKPGDSLRDRGGPRYTLSAVPGTPTAEFRRETLLLYRHEFELCCANELTSIYIYMCMCICVYLLGAKRGKTAGVLSGGALRERRGLVAAHRARTVCAVHNRTYARCYMYIAEDTYVSDVHRGGFEYFFLRMHGHVRRSRTYASSRARARARSAMKRVRERGERVLQRRLCFVRARLGL